MKFASTAELKNQTNALLREVEGGTTLVVTRHGKPIVALQRCGEEDIEDLVLESDPDIRRSIEEADADFDADRGIPLSDYASKTS